MTTLDTLGNIHAQVRQRISRADLIVLAASVVIMDGIQGKRGMDLIRDFFWGRVDSNICNDEGNKLPSPTGISTLSCEMSQLDLV